MHLFEGEQFTMSVFLHRGVWQPRHDMHGSKLQANSKKPIFTPSKGISWYCMWDTSLEFFLWIVTIAVFFFQNIFLSSEKMSHWGIWISLIQSRTWWSFDWNESSLRDSDFNIDFSVMVKKEAVLCTESRKRFFFYNEGLKFRQTFWTSQFTPVISFNIIWFTWAYYNDLSRGHLKLRFSKGIPPKSP